MPPRSFASFLAPVLALSASAVLVAACGGNVIVDKPGGTTDPECNAPDISCGGACVNPYSDPYNCGDCDIVCGEGFCDGGSCIVGPGCPPGLSQCNGSCADLANDPSNCGFCNNACAPGTTCAGGGCQVSECLCGSICTIVSLGSLVPQAIGGTTDGGLDQVGPICSGFGGKDVVYSFFAPFDGLYTFDTFGSTFDTVLQVMDAGCGVLDCNDDVASSGASAVVVKLAGGEQVLIVVDELGSGGKFLLNITQGDQPNNCTTCADFLTNGGDMLCPQSEAIYNTLVECVCNGACAGKCNDNACAGQDLTPECQDCITDTNKGCGNEFNECANDL
jgi:hypothetical protein